MRQANHNHRISNNNTAQTNQREQIKKTRNRTHGNSVNAGRHSQIPYDIYQITTTHSPNSIGRANPRERSAHGLNHSNAQLLIEPGFGKNKQDNSVINVHQHFNHQNIMNFNHNDYFKQNNMNSEGQSPNIPHPNLLEEGLQQFGAFPPDNFDFLEDSSAIQRGHSAIIANRKRIVSGIQPSKKNNQSMFYQKLKPFIRASSTQNLQHQLFRRQEGRNTIIRNLKSTNQPKQHKNRQALDKLNYILKSRRLSQLQSAKQRSLNEYATSDVNFVIGDNISQSTMLAPLKVDSTIQQHQGQQIIDDESSVKSADNGMNEIVSFYKIVTKSNSKSRQKYRTGSVNFTPGEKEAMQNQLFLLKTQLNMFKENNTMLRTQNQTSQDRLKTKQKLIQELVAITEDQDQRIKGNFSQLPFTQESQTLQRVRLIQQVNDLKQKLSEKTREFTQLKQDVKTTKIKEIQQEIQIYQLECLRLRSIAEQAFHIIASNGLQKLLKKNNQLKAFFRETAKCANNQIATSTFTKEGDDELSKRQVNDQKDRIIQLENELSDMHDKLNFSQQLLLQFESKEVKWNKERTQLNLLLKQASNLQEQYQEKINEQDQVIFNQSMKVKKPSPRKKKKDAAVQTEQQDSQILAANTSLKLEAQTLVIEKNEAIKQVEQLQMTIIQQNKDYISLQKMYQQAQKNQTTIDTEEHNQLKFKFKKLQEQHDSTIESNKLLIDNLRKTVQKLNNQLDECQSMNEQLFEEINMIKEKLLERNIQIEDFEFSSESTRSLQNYKLKKNMPKNRIPNCPVQYIKREKTQVSAGCRKLGSPVHIINEEMEEEDGVKEQTELLSPVSDSDRMGLIKLQQDIMQKNIRKQRKSDAYLRANSHINPGMKKHDMLEKFVNNAQNKQPNVISNDLLAAIDRINDGQTMSDIDNTSGIISQVTKKNLEMRSIVLREDPNIQLALRRLARMQQIKRLNLDFIERELFDEEYKVSKQIRIVDLANIFGIKLGLTKPQANSFARFLVEEIDENNPNQEQIQYNPRLKTNFSMIVVRLMTYSLYPIIYRDNHEREAKTKFKTAFSNHAKWVKLLALFDNDRKLYDISDFYSNIDKCLGKGFLNDQTIDCMYVILCRGVSFNEISKLSEKQLIESYQGFYAIALQRVFESISETNSPPILNERLDTQHRSSSQSNQSFHKPRIGAPTSIIKVLQLGETLEEDSKSRKNSSPMVQQLSELQLNRMESRHKKYNHQKTSKTNDNGFSNPSLVDLAYSDPRSETDWDLQESRNDISPTMLQEFVRIQSNKTLIQKAEQSQNSNEKASFKYKTNLIQEHQNQLQEVANQNQFGITNEDEASLRNSPNFKRHHENFEKEVLHYFDTKLVQHTQNQPLVVQFQQTAETESEAEVVRNIFEQDVFQADNLTYEPNEIRIAQFNMASFKIRSPVIRNNKNVQIGSKLKSFSIISQHDRVSPELKPNFIKSHTKENFSQLDEGKQESSAGFTLYERDKQSVDSQKQMVNKPSQHDSFEQSHPMNGSMSEIQEKSPEMSQKGEFCISKDKDDQFENNNSKTETQNTPQLPTIPVSILKIREQTCIIDGFGQITSRVDEDKANSLRQFIIKEFNTKIEDNLKSTINLKGVTKIVGICVEVLVLFSFFLNEQQISSIRAYFSPVIYQVGTKQPIEIIKNTDLILKFEECLKFKLDDSQRQALTIIWQNQQFYGYVQFSEIIRCLELLGHQEAYLQYHNKSISDLDAQSIRLLNSINQYLINTNQDVQGMLGELTEIKRFKTKSQETKEIECVNIVNLLSLLLRLDLIKDLTGYESFQKFMCINQTLNQLIPLDKFAQILELTSQDPYCQSFSTQPQFLPYDEQMRSFISSATASQRSLEIIDDFGINDQNSQNHSIQKQKEPMNQAVPQQVLCQFEKQASSEQSLQGTQVDMTEYCESESGQTSSKQQQ